MTEKKYIVLTDIKEFTYKNALLTSSQIEQMLQKFDEIVVALTKKYDDANKIAIKKIDLRVALTY